MKKLVVVLLVVAMVVSSILLAQKKVEIEYDAQWKKIEELAAKQLPESALKETEIIYKKAMEENNIQQLIKATIYKMRFTLEKEPDKAPELIRDFEGYTEKSTDLTEKALLLSMTAELYAQQYQYNSWTINKRTEVTGFVPEDINEWTKNIYFDKISKLLAASLQNADQLQKTDALKFGELLEKGDDSRSLQPTIFDLLANRRIEILQSIGVATKTENPLDDVKYFAQAENFISLQLDETFKNSVENQVLDTYQKLLAFRLKEDNVAALLLADLNRLQYISNESQSELKDELYLNALHLLKKKYSNNEVVVEVMAKLANYYLRLNNDEQKNNKRLAYEICAEGIRNFPAYKRIGWLKNIQKIITQKTLNVNHKELAHPFSKILIDVKSQNINTLTVNIYKVNATAIQYLDFKYNRSNYKSIYPDRTLISTKEVQIKPDPNFSAIDTTVLIESGDYGIYEISVTEKANTNEEEVSNTVLVVTDFGVMSRSEEFQNQSWYVLNRTTGMQQSDVKVAAYQRKWSGEGYKHNLLKQVVTDKNGYFSIPYSTNYNEQIIFLEKGKDRFYSTLSYAYFINNQSNKTETPELTILTDRSLYRPGQTVYFKGIAFIASKNKQEVVKNASYEVTLMDANYQKVSSKTFKTNEFGSFAGEFILPDGGLNGAYRLQSGNFSQTIYVEEYKRPTFEVKIEKPKDEIRFGEKVTLTGNVKAYAGYSIGNAKVKYRVVRRTHRFCLWWNEPEKEITNGTVKSNPDGKFEVSFVPEKPVNDGGNWLGSFYTYTLMVDVTDPKGETQQGEQSVSVGDKSLFIIASVPDKMDKNEDARLNIYTETLNGEKINSMIDYEIYQLENLTDFIENYKEKTDVNVKSKVQSGKFNTADKTLKLNLKKLKSAQYKLILKTKDNHGNEVKSEHTFIVYDLKDKRPPVKTYQWLLSEKKEYNPGEKAFIRFGTSMLKTPVLYELMQGNKIIESKWISLSNEIKVFEIPFKEEYGAGVTVVFTFMKDEKFFTEQIRISRKFTEKKLTPKLSVFRDKLLPGEKAEWTITIPEISDSIKTAELLAGMYDASLDAIRPHSWSFSPVYLDWFYASPAWNCTLNYAKSSGYIHFADNYDEVSELLFDKIDWFGLEFGRRYYGGPIRTRGTKSLGREEMVVMHNAEVSSVSDALQGKVAGVAVSEEETDDVAFQMVEKIERPKLKPVKPRTNFAETAFFYPQLKTDAQGNVKFSFTAPESLTRWNVKLLAHTPDLYYGSLDTTAVTQKDVMVQMNLPRFVRRSDKLTLSANVINLSDKDLRANVTLNLIDPATEKVIFSQTKTAPLSLRRGAGGEVLEWELSEFSKYELVICKIIAEAGNFSDGEQKYLPVLPDKVLITESLPLTIRGNQTRIFNFESLMKNASKVDNKNLTIEFSSNPAWYAVQALPTLSAPENDNALDLFTAYYVNSLAGFIANSNPKITKIFDQWKTVKGSRDALLSNLQQNAELKNMLLEETPWVMAAKDETEQKRQIALLFDLNIQKNQAQQYLDKLLKLQQHDGGFTWFEGMPSSRYITQEILLNFARLKKMTGQQTTDNSEINSTLTKALNYLDLEISRDFVELKKYNKNYQKENCVGNIQLFYLHTRSEYPEIPVAEVAQKAVKYYTSQSEKYWTTFTLYGKAMMAVVAQRNGKTKIAADILKSLKENALKTDEFGMYWAKNTAGYFWNERPVAVQAAIIEAFAEISKNTADIDELKIWLLKQKQTQRWDSPIASVNAIYALLLQGSDWLATDGKVQITAGNKLITPAKVEAGTGYFKETIPVNEIRSETGKIKVEKTDKNIGWGAVYWQYYREQDKVQNSAAGLKITKKLFVKEGAKMLPFEQVQVKKGDKIVTRLVISTDRNLEYVALKDLRAACFEPVEQRSGCYWKESVGYYQTTKDASTQFFFSFLPKGTYVFEYELWANNSGTFTSGITSVQCQYAPEFVSYAGGEKIIVK